MIQTKEELDQWYGSEDPWSYESNPEDTKRKSILLSEIPNREYNRVLDIGCGQGFITKDLPGQRIIGIDLSSEAITKAKNLESDKLRFQQCDLFNIHKELAGEFDLIIITGVLYPQYIGASVNLVYLLIDQLLSENGVLISVHIDEWYQARFPYLQLQEFCYPYRQYFHKLEIYIK